MNQIPALILHLLDQARSDRAVDAMLSAQRSDRSAAARIGTRLRSDWPMPQLESY
jgi:hypothetical protein